MLRTASKPSLYTHLLYTRINIYTKPRICILTYKTSAIGDVRQSYFRPQLMVTVSPRARRCAVSPYKHRKEEVFSLYTTFRLVATGDVRNWKFRQRETSWRSIPTIQAILSLAVCVDFSLINISHCYIMHLYLFTDLYYRLHRSRQTPCSSRRYNAMRYLSIPVAGNSMLRMELHLRWCHLWRICPCLFWNCCYCVRFVALNFVIMSLSLMDLPNEILDLIMRHCDYDDLKTLAKVNPQLYKRQKYVRLLQKINYIGMIASASTPLPSCTRTPTVSMKCQTVFGKRISIQKLDCGCTTKGTTSAT